MRNTTYKHHPHPGSTGWDGETVTGSVVGGEFVDDDDADGRPKGVYIIIKLDDERSAIVGGPVTVTYLPMPKATPQ